MSQTLLREHVKLAIQRAKTYMDAKDVEFSEAIIEALEELAAVKVSKATDVTSGNIPTFDANAEAILQKVNTLVGSLSNLSTQEKTNLIE